ncbi:hypothetical protein [Sphingomonas sp. KR3-1]|uniref:hypothetical protein n=1 Tax=Sphingomonas sp. KR3-1 TaxID=3156611 RepID=UPI0032B3E3E5
MSIRTPARLLALGAFLLLAACATRVPGTIQPGAPGFLLGLWHGFIFPVAWFLRLIVPEVSVYAVPNNGGWYDFGYFLGICVFGVGANRGTKVTKIVYRDRVVRRDARVIDHE